MPYIQKEARDLIDPHIDRVPVWTAGELAYIITRFCQTYLKIHGTSYLNLALVEGVLGTVKAELYRRVTAEYEDYKKGENGDVF